MMKQIHTLSLLPCACLWLSCAAARAQDPPEAAPPPLTFNTPAQTLGVSTVAAGAVDPLHSAVIALLKRKDVLAELKLTDAQKVRIEGIIKDYPDGLMKAQRGPINAVSHEEMLQLTPEQRQELSARTAAAGTKYRLDTENRIDNALSRNQAIRLHELDLQWRTPMAVAGDGIRNRIGLSQDQVTQIHNLIAEYSTLSSSAIQDGVAEWRSHSQPKSARPATEKDRLASLQMMMHKLQPRMNQIRTDQGDKALSVLTSAQQDEWRTAAGPEFSFQVE